MTRALRLVAARWPVLLAWFLAGWLARYLLIELAAFFGATSALLGLLILPLAVLARLGSYIAMFLVLRDDMPAFSSMDARGVDAIDRTTTTDAPGRERGKVAEIFLITILPFFAFYAAWKFLTADIQAYATGAIENINPFAEGPAPTANVLDLGLDAWTIAVIVIAYTGRFLLKRFAAKLPKWTNLVAVYLESVWVFLTLFLITNYTGAVQQWVASRAATVWLEQVKATVVSVFAPLGWIWDGVEWVINEAGALLLLPLAWLTLAGIVFGRALVKPSIRYRPQHRAYTGVRDRVTALPKGVQRRLKDVGNDWVDRWRPLANAVLLIWRAGVVPMGLYVLAYVVLEAAISWLLLAGVRIIGPHDLYGWWRNFDGILVFVVTAIIEPVRIALIAAAYDFCLRKLEERRDAVSAASADPEPPPSELQAQEAR